MLLAPERKRRGSPRVGKGTTTTTMGTSKSPKLKAWASVKSVRAATRLKRSVSSSSASSRALRKTKARLMRLDARERPRRARDRRWRLRGEANGVRVFVEESCRRSWKFNVVPLVVSVVAFGLHRFQYIPSPFLLIIAILLLVMTDASMGKWRITGRVRADVRVEASPETAFAFLAASDPSVKREWSAWFEHHSVRSFDAHTALVDVVEAAPLSWARVLAPMPRISRTIRFWSREGRTYTIIAADADGTEESSQNKLEWRIGVRTRTTEDLTVVRPRRTHGAEITRDGVMTAAVVTRVLDQDARLWCSRRSSLALAWSCQKLVDELRGLQLACAHLVDDASFLDQRSHFNYSPAQLQRDAKLSGRSRAATHDDDDESETSSDDEGTRLFRACAATPDSPLSETFSFAREPSTPSQKYASVFVLKRSTGEDSKWGAFAEPVATDFKVRGKNYLQDRKKMRSESSLCELAGVDALKATDGPLLNLGSRSDSPVPVSQK